MVPWKATEPRRMMVTLSQISSTSSMWWEESKTVKPLSASRLTKARMSRIPPGSRPLAGSSSTSRRGSRSRLAATPEPLPHPVGVAADLVVLATRQVDDVEDLRDLLRPVASVEEGEAIEVLAAGQVRVEPRALDEPGHPIKDTDAGLGPGLARTPACCPSRGE